MDTRNSQEPYKVMSKEQDYTFTTMYRDKEYARELRRRDLEDLFDKVCLNMLNGLGPKLMESHNIDETFERVMDHAMTYMHVRKEMIRQLHSEFPDGEA